MSAFICFAIAAANVAFALVPGNSMAALNWAAALFAGLVGIAISM